MFTYSYLWLRITVYASVFKNMDALYLRMAKYVSVLLLGGYS